MTSLLRDQREWIPVTAVVRKTSERKSASWSNTCMNRKEVQYVSYRRPRANALLKTSGTGQVFPESGTVLPTGMVLLPIRLEYRSLRIFLGWIWIAAHFPERQRLHRLSQNRVQVRILVPTHIMQNEIPLPARTRGTSGNAKSQPHFISGPQNHQPVVGFSTSGFTSP